MAIEDDGAEEEEAINAGKKRAEVEEEMWPLITVDDGEQYIVPFECNQSNESELGDLSLPCLPNFTMADQ